MNVVIQTKINMEFKCERCNPDHDYKTNAQMKQHMNSASHKRKFDPEFAAAEQAEKAAKKAAEEIDAVAEKATKKAARGAVARDAKDKA